jgi:hypothetical protein
MTSAIVQSGDFIKVAGYIDEHADFQILLKFFGDLKIDLEELQGINSIAVARFIRLGQARVGFKTEFHRCSSAFINVINTVPSILGPKQDPSVIQTFYFPYACSSCNLTTQMLIETATLLSQGNAISLPVLNCPKCSTVMRLDEDPEDYLFFLTMKR